MNINRRKFIAQSSLFTTFAISGTKSSGKIIGANDRINVAVCGIKEEVHPTWVGMADKKML